MKKPLALVAVAITLIGHSFAQEIAPNARLDTGISKGLVQLVREALDDGASISKRDPFGRTPLINAAWAGNDTIVALLLLRGADLHAQDKLGSTALHKAIRGRNERVVQLLLSEGADQNAQNNEGNTPLHVAVVANNPGMIRLLLRNGADATIKNDEGLTPVDIAHEKDLSGALNVFEDVKENIPSAPPHKRQRVYKDVVTMLRAQSH